MFISLALVYSHRLLTPLAGKPALRPPATPASLLDLVAIHILVMVIATANTQQDDLSPEEQKNAEDGDRGAGSENAEMELSEG
jgi:hypothetical protein